MWNVIVSSECLRKTMRETCIKVVLTSLVLCLIFTGYTIVRDNSWKRKIQQKIFRLTSEITENYTYLNPWRAQFGPKLTVHSSSNKIFDVEVRSKSSIELYLRKLILEESMDGKWINGTITVNNIRFIFQDGRSAKRAENLLLILRSDVYNKTPTFQENLLIESLHNLSPQCNVGLVFLGSETCNNSWLHKYMHYNGGLVKFVFMVYDSPEIDNVHFYQWPLGVAMHPKRGFPTVNSSKIPVSVKRKYICNFFGTIYKKSSRETLMEILEESDFLKEKCLINVRREWQYNETLATMPHYVEALSQSDLTLNPVGKNTECYRIYEAISYGSIPVVEDIMTPGNCGRSKTSNIFPLRLLKEMGAPIIYIKDWSELTKILENEKKLRHSEIVKRRRNILLWYESFKSKMGQKLIAAINRHFFGLNK